jgi:uroporphyrinogen decarboxylase
VLIFKAEIENNNFEKIFYLMLKNDLILRAANNQLVERTPVWMMRQAGRILPEYRAVRAKMGDFISLVKTPEFACEVTIQPVDILGVDAAIIFSDILVIPEAMGLPYKMIESKGPWFEKTIQTKDDINSIHIAHLNNYQYVIDAIKLTKKELNNRVPLIGFAGAPFTILAYMVEGSGSKTFSKAKKWMFTQAHEAHQLLELITLSTINYLKDQIKAGADMVQLFDSWAGILSPQHYEEFALFYIQKICKAIKDEFPETPITVFAKGAFFARENMGKLSCDVIGLDWNMDIKESRALIGKNKTLQGNLDPCILYSDDKTIVAETEKMLREFGPTGHIANLGHGIYPDIEKEKAKLFIETVKNYKHTY